MSFETRSEHQDLRRDFRVPELLPHRARNSTGACGGACRARLPCLVGHREMPAEKEASRECLEGDRGIRHLRTYRFTSVRQFDLVHAGNAEGRCTARKRSQDRPSYTERHSSSNRDTWIEKPRSGPQAANRCRGRDTRGNATEQLRLCYSRQIGARKSTSACSDSSVSGERPYLRSICFRLSAMPQMISLSR